MEQPRPTGTQRQQLLLEELQKSQSEMTGQQLHRCLEGQAGAMGLATVYRNLRKLHQSQAIQLDRRDPDNRVCQRGLQHPVVIGWCVYDSLAGDLGRALT